jgi:hypothetical protein
MFRLVTAVCQQLLTLHAILLVLVAAAVVKSYMVSDARSNDSEGWSLIDNGSISDADMCTVYSRDTGVRHPSSLNKKSDLPGTVARQLLLPTVLHYCQMLRIGLYMFGKRQPKLKGIFSCEGAYVAATPEHVGTLRVRVSVCACSHAYL